MNSALEQLRRECDIRATENLELCKEIDSLQSKLGEAEKELKAANDAWHEQEERLHELKSRLDNALAWYKLAAEQRDALVGRLDSVKKFCEGGLYSDGRAYDGHSMACKEVLMLLDETPVNAPVVEKL